MARQGTGRKKIRIEKMANANNRDVTFSKRRVGLFKKASELSTLCGCEMAIIVFSSGQRAYSFAHPGVQSVINRFLDDSNDLDPQGIGRTYDIMEARREENIRALNEQLMEQDEIIKSEKKLIKDREDMLRRRNPCWWLTPINELGLEEAKKMLTKCGELLTDLRIVDRNENVIMENSVSGKNCGGVDVVPSAPQVEFNSSESDGLLIPFVGGSDNGDSGGSVSGASLHFLMASGSHNCDNPYEPPYELNNGLFSIMNPANENRKSSFVGTSSGGDGGFSGGAPPQVKYVVSGSQNHRTCIFNGNRIFGGGSGASPHVNYFSGSHNHQTGNLNDIINGIFSGGGGFGSGAVNDNSIFSGGGGFSRGAGVPPQANYVSGYHNHRAGTFNGNGCYFTGGGSSGSGFNSSGPPPGAKYILGSSGTFNENNIFTAPPPQANCVFRISGGGGTFQESDDIFSGFGSDTTPEANYVIKTTFGSRNYEGSGGVDGCFGGGGGGGGGGFGGSAILQDDYGVWAFNRSDHY